MGHRITIRVAALGLALALAPASPILAEENPVEARLVASLTQQGYTIVEEGYTFLGRLRIVAQNDTLRREIVVNPGTGEVLRDYAQALADIAPPAVQQANGTGHRSSGSGAGTVAGAAVAPTDAGRSGGGDAAPEGADTILLSPALEN